jgi:hypothetical protein
MEYIVTGDSKIRSSKMSRYISAVLWLTCLGGFIYQLYQVSAHYFSYSTTTKTTIVIKEKAFYTTTVFCARAIDLFDKNNKSPNLTIKQIFQMTPKSRDVIQACSYRNEATNVMSTYQRDSCLRGFFNVSRVVSNEHVCYYFIPHIDTDYSLEDVTSQLTHANALYELVLIPKMRTSSSSFVISHTVRRGDTTQHPLLSRRYAERVFQSKAQPTGHIVVYHAATKVTILPKPYDTQCTPNFNGTKFNSNLCYHNCLVREFKKFNKIPWHSFVYETSEDEVLNMRLLSHSDLKENLILIWINKSEEICDNECRKQKIRCSYGFSQTRAVSFASEGSDDGPLKITAMMPGAPEIQMTTIPIMTLIEYVLLVGSCLGLWFGGSVWALNPTNIEKVKEAFSKYKIDRRFKSRVSQQTGLLRYANQYANESPFFISTFSMKKRYAMQ